MLVFLPGFMASARWYRSLLQPVARSGVTCLVPQLYRRGPRALSGAVPVPQEAAAAAGLLDSLAAANPRSPLLLGGHSRGGQAAWLTAAGGPRTPAALVLVDPVDGEGRSAVQPTTTASGARVGCPTLVIGAGVGGPCAPGPVNHRVFAEATPGCRHITLDMGHADVLDDAPARLGRRLCGGSDSASAARADCSALIAGFIAQSLATTGSS